MGDNKEKDKEKVLTPTPKENPEPKAQDIPDKEGEKPKPEPKSETPDKSEDTIKSLQGQISKLQRELNEKSDVKAQLKELLGEEETESDVDPVEVLTTKLNNLESEIQKEKAENFKHSYIDNLDMEVLTEGKRKYLKRKVSASMDEKELESAITEELKTLDEILADQTPQATDSRPYGVGATVGDSMDATHVLENPDAYRK